MEKIVKKHWKDLKKTSFQVRLPYDPLGNFFSSESIRSLNSCAEEIAWCNPTMRRYTSSFKPLPQTLH
jgi:hypothetical protein